MSAWWAMKISPSTAGAAPTSATFSTSSAITPTPRSSGWSRTIVRRRTFSKPPSAVVANNKERKGKWLWTDSGAGEPIELYEAPDAENEALFIADTIEKTLSRNPDYRVAVLYRTNFQSRQIEEALAALRPQVHRGRRLQLLSAGGSQGYSRLSEGRQQSKRFHQPAAHYQHSGARHRQNHGGADRAVRANEHQLSVWGAIGSCSRSAHSRRGRKLPSMLSKR